MFSRGDSKTKTFSSGNAKTKKKSPEGVQDTTPQTSFPTPPAPGSGTDEKSSSTSVIPSISLPKGGGAIHDMGEKFNVNAATGTGSMTVPIFTTHARNKMQPDLSLSYSSGSGNGEFGLGWRLSETAITRKTDKGLPRYRDADPDSLETDVFLLSNAEDLVPVFQRDGNGNVVLDTNGRPVIQDTITDGFAVRRYMPRIEGSFIRIERWSNLSTPGDIHWRTITGDNTTTIFGRDSNSRISDPNNPARTFSWRISETYDTHGNAISYIYKPEDSTNVNIALPNEVNRTDTTRSANRYLKFINYGNLTANRDPTTWIASSASLLPSTTWMFTVVFDYGEHDPTNPTPTDSAPWLCRQDPFSSFRSGFDIRTYRLCQRILMFHQFPNELGKPSSLVSSTNLGYAENPIATYLSSATRMGYLSTATGYLSNSFPPLEFEYSQFPSDAELAKFTTQNIDPTSLGNLPQGVDGASYKWLDLDGEGLSGILTEQGQGWFYKRNLSSNNQIPDSTTVTSGNSSGNHAHKVTTAPRFGLVENLPTRPPVPVNGGRFTDINGDGKQDFVTMGPQLWGYYTRTDSGGWSDFRNFKIYPNINPRDPNLKFIDLTGDGFADILVSEEQVFVWYQSLAADGYGKENRIPLVFDENQNPRIIFADPEDTISLADMSGDGLMDILRIRNGDVCYWPNIGYGNFGAKVRMSNAPVFDGYPSFNQKFIRLADIDGSGTTDILYLKSDGVDIYLNQSGNGYADRKHLNIFPPLDDTSVVEAVDILGAGTPCLVWSSKLPGNSRIPMQYVNLMPTKPHLLTKWANNFGMETKIYYTPSTKFYLQDQQDGNPWLTKLPFPVQCVERVEVFDYVSHHRYSNRYAYHSGFYDGLEREFRGFAMVEEWDTDVFEISFPETGVNNDPQWHVPPVYTKTWFHTGVYVGEGKISKQFAAQYFGANNPSIDAFSITLLDDSILPVEPLNYYGTREACRALKGHILRQEVYGLTANPKATIPYTITESSYSINTLQTPQDAHFHSVFLVIPRETIHFALDQNMDDPRIQQEFTLQTDQFGNTLKSLNIAYGRKPANSQFSQAQALLVYAEHDMTNSVYDADNYVIPRPCETRTYQVYGVDVGSTRLQIADYIANDYAAVAGLPVITFETQYNGQGQQKRLIDRSRILYRSDDLSQLLPTGTVQSLYIPGESYKLTFTPGLLTNIFQRTFGGATQNLIPNPTTSLGTQGGYVQLDSDGNWWTPSGRSYFTTANVTPAQELTQARAHFFNPVRQNDPFGNSTVVSYDVYDLLPISTTDALGNVIQAQNDYRVIQPDLITDPNGNRTQVAFDELGLLVGSAVMGKTTENLGDTLVGFSATLTQDQIDSYFANPTGPIAATLLANATTRIVYDISRYYNSRTTGKLPVFSSTISREVHYTDPTNVGKLQINFSYSDGFGRVVQQKAWADPGLVNGQMVNTRWIGTGWTVFNNKGNPVRQFEPFFDNTNDYKYDEQVGVAKILCYDPVDRVVASIFPNHSWNKSVYSPWQLTTWDTGDTVLQQDPSTDVDVGQIIRQVPRTDYFPTWYYNRNTGQLGPQEEDAAVKASAYANTPTVAYADALGHTIAIIEDDGADGKYTTQTILDIKGNKLQTIDANSRIVESQDYDMLGDVIHHASMEAGERWALQDCMGKSVLSWDSRGQTFQTSYDALRRPLQVVVTTPTVTVTAELYVYGESNPTAAQNNLLGKVWQISDQSGTLTNEMYDFKGNLAWNRRQFAQEYKTMVDWSAAVVLDPRQFDTRITYDALNRVVEHTAPDTSITHYDYNQARLVQAIKANIGGSQLNGQPNWTQFVSNVDYNARSQRLAIQHGNGVSINYTYDPLTFRVSRIQTVQAASTFQDLNYFYDPVGNVTYIRDDGQQTIYFRNAVVTPSNDYTYDPTYRLIAATGREHLGQINGAPSPIAPDPFDSGTTGLNPNIANAMGAYLETYQYDPVGNILSVQHQGSNPTAPGWTRTYSYNEPSQLQSNQVSNRLSATTVGSAVSHYSYAGNAGPHGNMTAMSHLSVMQWDYKDRLQATAQQNVNSGVPETTYYVYDTNGQRVRKVTERQAAQGTVPTLLKEHLYLDTYDDFIKYAADGVTATLQRGTLNITDAGKCFVLAESTTIAPSGPVQLIRYQYSNTLGSICLELDDTAQVISYEEYAPYGNTTYQAVRSQTEAPKRYRYNQKERDKESGLYYYGSRYYAPWIGRWTATDPGGTQDGVDLYTYVRCNPVRLIDPNGNASGDSDRSWFLRQALAVDDAIRANPMLKGAFDNMEKRGEAIANLPQTLSQMSAKEIAIGVLRAPGQLIVDTGKAAVTIAQNAPAAIKGDAKAKEKIGSAAVDLVLNTADLVTMAEGAGALEAGGKGLAKGLAGGARQMVTDTGHVIVTGAKEAAAVTPLVKAGAIMMMESKNIPGGATKPKPTPGDIPASNPEKLKEGLARQEKALSKMDPMKPRVSGIEKHHLLSGRGELKKWFEMKERNFDVQDFQVDIPTEIHDLTRGAQGYESSGKIWNDFKKANPHATPEQVLEKVRDMMDYYGIDRTKYPVERL